MQAQRKLVSFIGLGSQTAAPLLYAYIAEHPLVCVPGGQTHFFSNAKRYAKGVEWYETTFALSKKPVVCGELALSYLHSTQAAALIAKTYPSAKLFAVIEDPLLCVRVSYVEALQSGIISRHISLAQFIKNNPEVLLRAKFGRQLVHYFGYYSARDLLVLTAREVRDEPILVLENIFKHIGLDSTFVPISLRHLVVVEEDGAKKRPGIIKRMYRKIKQGVSFLYTQIMKTVFPPKIPKETTMMIAEKIPLSPELESYLKDYFREDVRELSALLHQDFNVRWSI
jgi:hypothetical protein